MNCKKKAYIVLILLFFILNSCITTQKNNKILSNNSIVKKKPESYSSYYYFNLGLLEENNNNITNAIKYFKKALTLDKKSVTIYEEIAGCYSQLNDYTNAIKYLQKGEKYNPENLHLKFLLVDAYLLNNDNKSAINKLTQIINLSPTNAEAYFEIGTIYHDMNKYYKAVEYYKKSLSINTNFERALYNICDIYFQFGLYKKAEKYFQRLYNISSGDNEIKYIYAFLLKKVGEYKKAEKIYRDLLNIYTENNKIKENLLEIYYLNDNIPETKKYLNNIIIYTDNYYLLSGMKNEINNRPEKAILFFKKVISIDSNNLVAQYGLHKSYKKIGKKNKARDVLLKCGLISLKNKNFNSAEEYFQEAKRIGDKSPTPYIYLALFYENQGLYKKAINEIKKALKIKKDEDLYFYLGNLYEENNEYKKAIRIFKKIRNKRLNEAYFHIAYNYNNLNKKKEALKYFKRILKNDNSNILAYLSIGGFYLENQEYQKALDYLLKGENIDSNNYLIHFYLATCYDKLNQKDKTIEELKIALKLKPDYADANNYLAYIYAEEGKNLEKALLLISRALEKYEDNFAYLDTLGWIYYKKGNLEKALNILKKAKKLMEKENKYDSTIDKHINIILNKLKEKKNE